MAEELAPLTARQRKAAILIAEDTMPLKRVAEECRTSEPTLKHWRERPDFQIVVAEKVAELDAAVSNLRFAKRRDRIEALSQQASDYERIRDERAMWYVENAPAVPGGGTGRLSRSTRIIGVGKNAERVEEDALDRGLETQFAATLQQIARERGEWSEKREHSGPNGTPLVPIVEIEVIMPIERGND